MLFWIVPGYKLIEEYANQQWGTGKRKVITNPTEVSKFIWPYFRTLNVLPWLQPDQVRRVATACVGSEVVQVQLSGLHKNISYQTFDSHIVQGNPVVIQETAKWGVIHRELMAPLRPACRPPILIWVTGVWNVRLMIDRCLKLWDSCSDSTAASSIGTSATVSATFKIPEILEVGPEITTSAEFTSEAAHRYDGLLDSQSCSDTASDVGSFSTTNSETITHTSTFNIPDGKNCEITVCTLILFASPFPQ